MATDGTGAPITAARIKAWWPPLAAIVLIAGGWFGFDGRLSAAEKSQDRMEKALGSLLAKIDTILSDQGRVALALALEQKKDADRYGDRLAAIEKALGKIEGRLDAAKDGK